MPEAIRRMWKLAGYRWGAGTLAGLIVLAAAGYLALKLTPDWFASDRFSDRKCVFGDRTYKECLDTAKARAIDRRSVTTATLAIFAGALSAFGAVYTARTFRQNRRASDQRHKIDLEAHALNRESAERTHALGRAGQLTERFTRAIEQLGSENLHVRLGGIYALERIARDSRSDHPQIVEVLTAYVRGQPDSVPKGPSLLRRRPRTQPTHLPPSPDTAASAAHEPETDASTDQRATAEPGPG